MNKRKRPYQARTDIVFQTLDKAASTGITTYKDLIEFVRLETGTACSKRLVSTWKKKCVGAYPTPGDSAEAQLYQEKPGKSQVNQGETNQGTASTTKPSLIGLPPRYRVTSLSRQSALCRIPATTPTSAKAEKLNTRDRNLNFYSARDRRSNKKNARPQVHLERLHQTACLVTAAAIGLGLILAGQRLLNAHDDGAANAQAQTTPHTQPGKEPAPAQSKSNPKTLKFSLSLSSPKDLKVRQGDMVSAGEVLAERAEERSHLTAQRQTLLLEYQQLITKIILTPPKPTPIPVVRSLPPISYDEEQAAISAAGLNVRQAERGFQLQQQAFKQAPVKESAAVQKAVVEVTNRQRLLDNQRRKIDAVSLLKDLPEDVLVHEQEVLKQREAELRQAEADYQQTQAELSAATQAQTEKLQQLGVVLERARADLQTSVAKLQTKKDQRSYTEYESSVQTARRAEERNFAAIAYLRQLQEAEQQQRDKSFQLAQSKNKIADIDKQILSLSVVRSPYSGVVQRIKFQRQHNNELSVELTLAISASVPSPSPGDSPASTPNTNPTSNTVS